MVGSTRAELVSSSLDCATLASGYPNGQRGSYSSSNLDRSGSFRESLDNRMMVSGPLVLKNAAPPVELPPVVQYMSLEPFSTTELKNVRSGELRRVLGIPVEDHSFGSSQSKPLPPISWEELKRFKASAEESSSKAKERKKSLQDSLIKLEKVRNAVARKRQRNEFQSNEKLSNSNLLKIGSQMHQNPSDVASQRLEERTKNGVPSKRVRSSMAEVSLPFSLQPEGGNTLPMRQSTMLDKDKNIVTDKDNNMLRACNGVPITTDDKIRGQMKRKRSVGGMVNRTPDGDRELKQAMQQRASNEPRSRSSDVIGFRTGSSNGTFGNNKMDYTCQASVDNACMVPRNDFGNGSLSNDRRERSSGLVKERVTAKGSNKMNICEDAQLGSQSPLTKGKAARAPRTGSGVMVNVPNFSRSSGCIDGLEQPSCLNKVQPLTGSSSRKCPLPTGSSSPPVAKWGGQRREKISRTRRTNVVSPVSNLDEVQVEGFVGPDLGARLSSSESVGVLFNRGLPISASLKLKLENAPSPAAPSESEESGAPENMSKERGIDNGEIEEGLLNATHKPASFLLPTKKNKTFPREEIGDGVRRQGRSGRGSMQSKACLQFNKEKTETVEASGSLKSRRLTSDKIESKIGRSLSKKVSDRKGSNRMQIINSGSSELAGNSDDDHEELLATAKAVQDNSCLIKSGPFWKQMEPIFSLVSSEDFALLKHQIDFAEELDGSFTNMLDADYNVMPENRFQKAPSNISQHASRVNLVVLSKCDGTTYAAESDLTNATPGKIEAGRWFDRSISLSQRLLSAYISEEESDSVDINVKQGDILWQSRVCSPCSTSSFLENGCGSDSSKYGLDFDNDTGSQTNYYGDSTPCNGFASPGTTFRSPSSFISGDELMQENDDLVHADNPDAGACFGLDQDKLGQRDSVTIGLSGSSPYQSQFECMSLDDKILMELHSIGLYPDALPDPSEGNDEEIDTAISELRTRLYQQTWEKKTPLCKLERGIQEWKECEMRNHEQLAMNMLVDTAYKKLLGGRSHGSSHKSGASKISKQLAMAFAKRTLARCRKFEETGQSCFTEPVLRDALFTRPVHGNDGKNADSISSSIPPNTPIESHNCQPSSRVYASGASANGIEGHGPVHKIDRCQLDPYHGLNHFSEQTFVRNDPISNRWKKKEVLLDDVVTGSASRATPPVTSTFSGGTKLKKTDKDYIELSTKSSAPKGSRPSLNTNRGERKAKAKPRQKVAHLSTSGNGLGRVTETTNMLPSMRESRDIVNAGSSRVNLEVELSSSQGLRNEVEDNIFTNLPLQGIDGIDELDVTDGLGDQGQDIGSWLNVDDDGLQDNDLVGLEIPMDDLSELKLNF